MNTTTALISVGLPQHYGWVGLAASSTFFLNFFQTLRVVKARKRANIKYPQMYADKAQVEANKDAFIFNCAQRAHMNTTENASYLLVTLLWSGLRYPQTAAALGFAWVFGRVLYTIGYTSGEPKNRNWGFFGSIAYIALGGLSAWSAIQLILEQN